MCLEITFWTIIICFVVYWKRKFFTLFISDFLKAIITISNSKKTKTILILSMHLIVFSFFFFTCAKVFFLAGSVFFKWKTFTTILMLVLLLNTTLIIQSPNAVKGLFLLIISFLTSATVLLFLGVQYIGLNLILIYLGAILILFVFVLMLLNSTPVNYNLYKKTYLVFLTLIWIKLGCSFNLLWNKTYFFYKKNTLDLLEQTTNIYSDVTLIANDLYTNQLLSLIIATVVLFIALIVSITLTTFKKDYI